MLKLDSRQFAKDMNNIINYSMGFLDGVKNGKKVFLDNLGANTIELMKQYIDTNARVNPEMLHHIYEWNRTGSPDARLYDLNYSVGANGLSIRSSFRQSTSFQDGSKTPFYDKARIMEYGIPVTIKPKNAKVLAFKADGEEVFTPNQVTVLNPGGQLVEGGFEKIFESFFQYFSQAFLQNSGLTKYLENPVAYKQNLQKGKTGGRSVGKAVGFGWIANAGLVR